MTYYILYIAKRRNAKRHILSKYNDYQEAINDYNKIVGNKYAHNYVYNYELTNGRFKTLMKNGEKINEHTSKV